MIIFNEQWYDEWKEEWIQLSFAINWWYTPPVIVFYSRGIEIYGEAHLIYDEVLNYQYTSYSKSNKYLEIRLKREIEQFVFTSF